MLPASTVALLTGILLLGGGTLRAEDDPAAAVHKIYGAQLAAVAGTPDPQDDIKLADTMVGDAKGLKNDPALARAVCHQALKLAVADPEAAKAPEKIVALLIARQWDTASQAWQALVTAADAAIDHRNDGPDDSMLPRIPEWQFQWVGALLKEQDLSNAAKLLDQLARTPGGQTAKFVRDRAKLMQARLQFEQAIQNAVTAAAGRAKADDPKSNLAAGETILAQSGNWAAAAPFLVKANDPTWNRILKWHQARKAPNRSPAYEIMPGLSGAVEPPSEPEPVLDLTGMPDAPDAAAPTAGDLFEAGKFLLAQAQPAKRPAVCGRVALLREAAALFKQAQELGDDGLAMAQKLEMVTKKRELEQEAAKALNELHAAFAKTAKLEWLDLSTGNLRADWKLCPGIDQWKILADGTLRLDNGNAATTLHSALTTMDDFVFEGEIKTLDTAHPSLTFRYRPGPLMWRMELEPHKLWWYYTRYDLEGEELFHGRCTFEPNQWNQVRVMMAGNSYSLAINGQVVTEGTMAKAAEPGSGGPGFGIFDGHSLLLRNLRIRELK